MCIQERLEFKQKVCYISKDVKLVRPFHTERKRKRKYLLMFVVISANLVAFASAFARFERAFKYDVLVHRSMLCFILNVDAMFTNVL